MNRPIITALTLFLMLIFVSCTAEGQQLVGEGSIDQLHEKPYKKWFKQAYQAYEVDKATLNDCVEGLLQMEITIVMGTWCSDSRREVPRMMKILDEYGLEPHRVVYLDKEKQGGEGQQEELGIEYVPTFIIYLHGDEAGRIIESPEVSLEKDLCKWVSGVQ